MTPAASQAIFLLMPMPMQATRALCTSGVYLVTYFEPLAAKAILGGMQDRPAGCRSLPTTPARSSGHGAGIEPARTRCMIVAVLRCQYNVS